MNILPPRVGVVGLKDEIEVRPVQPLNAYAPILVTFSGISIEIREEQLENAYWFIVVTLSGILIDLREVQL